MVALICGRHGAPRKGGHCVLFWIWDAVRLSGSCERCGGWADRVRFASHEEALGAHAHCTRRVRYALFYYNILTTSDERCCVEEMYLGW